MSNQQKKFQKKKEREKEVRKKVLRRRTAIRLEAKQKLEEEVRLETEYQLRNGKPEPILVNPEKIKEREIRKQEMVEERLQRNLEILEALEKEYDQEQQGREEANKVLEGEGHKSIKEKMQALYQKTLKFKESVEETRKELQEESQELSPVEKVNETLKDPSSLGTTPYAIGKSIDRVAQAEENICNDLGCTTTNNE